jgi:hypothetical protein
MSVVAPAAILFLHKGSIGSGIRLGFAAWSQTQIEQGLAKLAAAVKQLRQRAASNGSSLQTEPFSPGGALTGRRQLSRRRDIKISERNQSQPVVTRKFRQQY